MNDSIEHLRCVACGAYSQESGNDLCFKCAESERRELRGEPEPDPDLCGSCGAKVDGVMICDACETIVLQQIVDEVSANRTARRRERAWDRSRRPGGQKPHGTPPRWVR